MINGVENSEVYGILLDYFDPEEKEIGTKFLNEIEYDGDDELIIQCLGPVIFRIVRKIMSKKSSQFIKSNLHLLILMIDVEEITKKLIDFCDNCLPISCKYLQHIDAQVEMVALFSDNYVYGLIKRLENFDIKLIRELKLKKINKL